MSNNKDELLKNLYYHELGYQSISHLFKDAKKIDNNITLAYVKDWYNYFNETKKQLRGQNSYIAPQPYWEYQVDLFFLPEQPAPNIGLAMIDIYTKYAAVVPLKSKQPLDVGTGVHDALNKMGKKPNILYTDDEGSFNSKILQTYLANAQINHIISRSHPHYIERYIRTFKNLLYKRLEDTDKHWTDLIEPVLNVYNNKMISSITKLTPSEAREPKNTLDAKINLELKRRHTRTYPIIEIGDKANIYKKKDKFDKENKPVWLNGTHRVEEITKKFGQKFYKVSGFSKLLMRSELLKI